MLGHEQGERHTLVQRAATRIFLEGAARRIFRATGRESGTRSSRGQLYGYFSRGQLCGYFEGRAGRAAHTRPGGSHRDISRESSYTDISSHVQGKRHTLAQWGSHTDISREGSYTDISSHGQGERHTLVQGAAIQSGCRQRSTLFSQGYPCDLCDSMISVTFFVPETRFLSVCTLVTSAFLRFLGPQESCVL